VTNPPVVDNQLQTVTQNLSSTASYYRLNLLP